MVGHAPRVSLLKNGRQGRWPPRWAFAATLHASLTHNRWTCEAVSFYNAVFCLWRECWCWWFNVGHSRVKSRSGCSGEARRRRGVATTQIYRAFFTLLQSARSLTAPASIRYVQLAVALSLHSSFSSFSSRFSSRMRRRRWRIVPLGFLKSFLPFSRMPAMAVV